MALLVATPASAQTIAELLAKPILPPNTTLDQTKAFVASRLPKMPALSMRDAWDDYATKLRAKVLETAVFRGEAAKWRDAKCTVEMLNAVEGGEGYRIRKLRYEALPGLWVPALLYAPEKIGDKVAVMLAVNGHDPNGKAADYKQTRCINLAKRGMYVLNVEWFGMGQLRATGYGHGRMNLLDLCGSSGLAPFYLAMSRGIDILLDQPNADRTRVGVSGLSGGGWQTIIISSLDTRVTLTNPVAGYSSFRTRLEHSKDLGDSEQTPCDLAFAGADYDHLTAMLAPRAALLTYNSKDNCCFESGYALPPLLEAATPVYKLHGAAMKFRSHVNSDPGDHNFGQDNREALYRMVGDHFFAGQPFDAKEIPCAKEIRTKEQLEVPLPADNLDFQKLALKVAKDLPREAPEPFDDKSARAWQGRARAKLRDVLHLTESPATVEEKSKHVVDGVTVRQQVVTLKSGWSVPVTDFEPAQAKSAVVVLQDGGRAKALDTVNAMLKEGRRVIAPDLWYFGECHPASKDYLYALLVGTVGERPLAVQVSQLLAVIGGRGPTELVAVGPRSGVIALTAAAMSNRVARVELHQSMGTLREIIEQNRSFESSPELFCFGLLEVADLQHLAKIAAPTPVILREPSARAKETFASLKSWYRLLGLSFDPLAGGWLP